VDVHPVEYVLAQRGRKRTAKSISALGGRLFRVEFSVVLRTLYSRTLYRLPSISLFLNTLALV
jgi:hypothetical protein